jgi:hypothetical protein
MIAIFPEIASRAAAGDVDGLGILIRRYFGGAEPSAPRIDVRSVISSVGIKVESMALPSLAALLAKDDKGSFEIVALLKQGLDPVSERFMLAHMLGHFLFDIQPQIARGEWTLSGFQEFSCPLKRYSVGFNAAELSVADLKVEERADNFAAALLLPRGMVRRAMERLGDPEQVAAFFGVTRACLTRRLDQMTSTDTPVNFLAAEDRSVTTRPPVSGGAGRELSESLVAPPVPSSVRRGAIDQNPRAQSTTAADPRDARSMGATPKGARSGPAKNSGKGPGKGLGKDGMERIREIARLLDKNSPPES